MKKVLFFVLAVLWSLAAWSQIEITNVTLAGTTMEEWRYAAHGYRDDLDKGKDPAKAGYTFRRAYTFRTNTIVVDFVEMTKSGEVRALICNVNNRGAQSWYAFPTADCQPGVQDAFIERVRFEDSARYRLLLLALSEYALRK